MSRRPGKGAAEVLAELGHIARGDTAYPTYDKNGEETLCKPPMTARLKALELLGKHYDLFGGAGETSGDGLEIEVRVVE